jgi:hypothetical protein
MLLKANELIRKGADPQAKTALGKELSDLGTQFEAFTSRK